MRSSDFMTGMNMLYYYLFTDEYTRKKYATEINTKVLTVISSTVHVACRSNGERGVSSYTQKLPQQCVYDSIRQAVGLPSGTLQAELPERE